MANISVIGAGAWGTALAGLLSSKGFDVAIWALEKEVAEAINSTHMNPVYLPDVALPKGLKATNDLKDAVKGKDFIVSVVPSHALRRVFSSLSKWMPDSAIIVSCTKGIEVESLKLMSQVLDESLPSHDKKRRVVLSGPSFAKEVAEGLPTSVVVAGRDGNTCVEVQSLFRTETFLAFTSDDVTGVEVGGAVKNVIAIAAGISDGLGLGHNTRAAIITRGLYEMIKVGQALGANPLTFAGLSGIGDLVLTCTARLSRNHTVGERLGKGETIDEIKKDMKAVAEGVETARAVHKLMARHNINAPICKAVYQILFEGLGPRKAVAHLNSLPIKAELGSIIKAV